METAEREMIRRAIVPGLVACAVAFVIGAIAGGIDVGASAAAGIAVVVTNFAAHGLSLAWASRVSIPVLQAVALGGFVVRLAVIVAVMFALDAMAWFSPLAFGLAVVPSTLLLLVYESRLALRGLGATLNVPADAAAVRAAQRVAARETAE